MTAGREKTFRVRQCAEAPFFGEIREDLSLVIAGDIALAGSDEAAEAIKDILAERFSRSFYAGMKNQRKRLGADRFIREMTEDPAMMRKYGICAAVPAGDGGIFAALWDLAKKGGCGFKIDLRKIPLSQETIEICEILDLNPYRLDSGGAVILAAENAERLVSGFAAEGIPASVVGWICAGKACRIYSGETETFLDFPSADETIKIREKRGGLAYEDE